MTENNDICKGNHEGHICLLASQGNFEQIKKITKAPQFICFNCGRVADCEQNLCNPMPLNETDKIWT